MDRKEFTSYILNNYVTNEEHPWADSPDNSVFRHPSNKKWFALIMKIDNFLEGKSFFRAYHMNKTHWITVIIGAADENKLKMLLDVSFELTK